MSVRKFRQSDLPRLFEANEASVPGVGAETIDSLATWISLSTCFVAVDTHKHPLGFITLMEIGQSAYDSPNMRWFEAYADRTGKSVIYVDRIALLPEARGQKLGEALYETAFEAFRTTDQIGCEVNVLPPNPGSHRFHTRLGFHQVGAQTFVPDQKSVAYYARDL